jgi:hypothetical protein
MKNNTHQALRFFSLVLFFFCCFAFSINSADAASEMVLSKGQTVYVPVFPISTAVTGSTPFTWPPRSVFETRTRNMPSPFSLWTTMIQKANC